MDRRVLQERPDGTTAPAAHVIAEGEWWPDRWISPVLVLELGGQDRLRAITVSGYAPGVAPRQIDNTLALACGGARVTQALGWGEPFEATLRFDPPPGGALTLRIEVRECILPDGFDRRERGVTLGRIVLRTV